MEEEKQDGTTRSGGANNPIAFLMYRRDIMECIQETEQTQ